MNWPGRCRLLLLVAALLSGCNSVPSAGESNRGLRDSLSRWSPSGMSSSIRSVFKGPPPNEAEARQYFAAAEQAFDAATKLEGAPRRAAFREAVEPYTKASQRAPGSPLEEDALMMAAESHFFADDYVKAGEAYGELVKRYPSTRHIDRVDQRRFAIAQYWLSLEQQDQNWIWLPKVDKKRPAIDTLGHAIKMLDKIRFDNPTGKLADDATMAAAVANFERRRYGAAHILFSDIRENFPNSEHQFQAHLLGLKCLQLLYRGPDYDGGSLEQGEAMIERMFRLFPDQIAEHREYLETTYKEIRLKQAQRLYAVAEYYDRRKEFGAARVYYQDVKEQFADTNLSLEAESRLASIGGYPDAPEQPLKWLAEIFPEEETARPLLARDTVDTLNR